MAAVPDLELLIRKFKDRVQGISAALYDGLKHSLMNDFVLRMCSAGLVPESLLSPEIDSNSKYVKVMGQFKSIMNNESLEESERHCCKFLYVLKNMGDVVCSRIAEKLKESWISDAKSLNIKLTRIGKTMYSQEVGSGENDDNFVNAYHKQRYIEMRQEKLAKKNKQLTVADHGKYFIQAQPSGNGDGNQVWAMGSDHLRDENHKEVVSVFTDLSFGSSSISSVVRLTVSDDLKHFDDLEMIREGVQHCQLNKQDTESTMKPRMSLDKQRKEPVLELSSPMDTEEDNDQRRHQQQNLGSPITSTQNTSVPETGTNIDVASTSILSQARAGDTGRSRRRSSSLPQSYLNQMIVPNALSTAIPASGIEGEVMEQLKKISDRLSDIELSVKTQAECRCQEMIEELHEKDKEIFELKSLLKEKEAAITRYDRLLEVALTRSK